jgi:hypothetical protein
MRITGATRDGDVITFFHPTTSRAGAEIAPRTVISAGTILSFQISKVEEHAEQRFQRVAVQLLSGQPLGFNVVVSHDGKHSDIGLMALVADMLTAAMR